MDTNRKIVEKLILDVTRFHNYGKENRYTWGEIKQKLLKKSITLEDDDILDVTTNDEYSTLSVYRSHVETDEEYETRVKYESEGLERLKKQRYEQYLKLKEQFEPDKDCGHDCTCK